MDYTSGPYTVTFPAGVTMIAFDVPITDDMILEVDEIFILTINGATLPNGITCNTPGQATVTIVDNEISRGMKLYRNTLLYLLTSILKYLLILFQS